MPAAAPAPVNAQVQMRRFLENTRRHFIQNSTGIFQIDLGQTYNFDLDKIGLATGVVLKIGGFITLSAAGPLANQGPWSLLQRVKLKIPSGAALLDMTGYDLYQLNKRMRFGWGPDGAGNFTQHAEVFAAPVAAGVNQWRLHLWVPFSQNRGSLFEAGIFGLQSNVTQATLEITTRPASGDFVTLFTGEALTAEVHYEYFEPPLEGSNVAYPPSYVIKTITTQYPIVAAGQQLWEVPRQGILLDASVILVNNNLRTDALDFIRFRTNYGDYFEHRILSIDKFLYSLGFGHAADVGVFNFDFNSSGDLPFSGDMRDNYNLLKYSKTELDAQITAGTVITQPAYGRLVTRHWLPAKVVR